MTAKFLALAKTSGIGPFLAIFRADHGRLVGGPGGASAEDGGHAPHSRCGWVGAGVEKHSFVVRDRKFIAPLRCERCGGNAHLTRRSPHAVKDLEIRVFECHECGHQIEQVVIGEDYVS
jgi:hypothetical protein